MSTADRIDHASAVAVRVAGPTVLAAAVLTFFGWLTQSTLLVVCAVGVGVLLADLVLRHLPPTAYTDEED